MIVLLMLPKVLSEHSIEYFPGIVELKTGITASGKRVKVVLRRRTSAIVAIAIAITPTVVRTSSVLVVVFLPLLRVAEYLVCVRNLGKNCRCFATTFFRSLLVWVMFQR